MVNLISRRQFKIGLVLSKLISNRFRLILTMYRSRIFDNIVTFYAYFQSDKWGYDANMYDWITNFIFLHIKKFKNHNFDYTLNKYVSSVLNSAIPINSVEKKVSGVCFFDLYCVKLTFLSLFNFFDRSSKLTRSLRLRY